MPVQGAQAPLPQGAPGDRLRAICSGHLGKSHASRRTRLTRHGHRNETGEETRQAVSCRPRDPTLVSSLGMGCRGTAVTLPGGPRGLTSVPHGLSTVPQKHSKIKNKTKPDGAQSRKATRPAGHTPTMSPGLRVLHPFTSSAHHGIAAPAGGRRRAIAQAQGRCRHHSCAGRNSQVTWPAPSSPRQSSGLGFQGRRTRASQHVLSLKSSFLNPQHPTLTTHTQPAPLADPSPPGPTAVHQGPRTSSPHRPPLHLSVCVLSCNTGTITPTPCVDCGRRREAVIK